jgi:ABC-type branched-subunit amino acid transport system substrate-binding protein
VRRALAAALAAAAALGIAGCQSANSTSTSGDTISVYSLLPLQGPTATAAQDVVDGEKLALQQAGGRVGKLTVNFRSVDSSDNGRVDPGSAAKAARSAAQDAGAIAAIGSFGGAEARTEIPLLNEASVALVTTASLPAGLDDPELYPLGPRTFSRVAGSEASQAAAIKRLAAQRGCHRTAVVAGAAPGDRDLAARVARAAGAATTGSARASCTFLVGVIPPAARSGASGLTPDARESAAATSAFARVFRRRASPSALLGYAAMRSVLDAVRAAGTHGNDRAAVARQLQRVRPLPWTTLPPR